MALGKLLINVGANIADFESDMGKAARVAKKESDRIKKQIDVAMKAVATSAVAAGAALGTLVKVTANTADEIQKMSDRLGVSTEFLSQYRLVADLSGTSIEKVGDGVRKMSKSVNDANNGLSTATRAFDSLGISLDTLNSLSPEAQFELIADRISKVESQSVKAGAAMDIFGRSGSELLTVMNLGADGIKELRDQADSLGQTISQQAADAAALFNDRLTLLQARFTGMSEQIGNGLIPVVSEMVNQFNSSEIGDASGKINALNNVLISLYGGVLLVGDAFEVLGRAAGSFAGAAVQSFELADSALDVFLKRIQRGGLIIAGVFDDDALAASDELGREISELESKVSSLYDTFSNGDLSGTISEDAARVFSETIAKLDKLRTVASSTGKATDKDLNIPLKKVSGLFGDVAGGADKAEKALKKAQSVISKLSGEFRPISTSLQELTENLAALDAVPLSVDFTQADYDKGFELIQEQARKKFQEIIDQVKGIGEQIPVMFESVSDEVEKLDLSSAFDGFAAGLNPAIGALQSFKDEIGLINDLTANGDFTAGQQAFYSTGLAAEFALNSMASMAEEGSSAQKKLQAAAAITNTILGISAILEQGKGDPYTAFGRMAAMAALVASLGV